MPGNSNGRPEQGIFEIHVDGGACDSNGYSFDQVHGMTVEEFIQVLKDQNPRAQVVFTCVHGIVHSVHRIDFRSYDWEGSSLDEE